MINHLKLTLCAVALAAITTTAAHANLIQVGTITDDPLAFSTVLHFNPGQGGDNSYSTQVGANWFFDISDLNDGMLLLRARHEAVPHPGEEFSGPTWIVSFNPAAASDTTESFAHPPLTGHTDSFSLTVEPLTPTSQVWVITVSGFHSPGVDAVPDTASSVMLLGLGLTALGSVRRFVRR